MIYLRHAFPKEGSLGGNDWLLCVSVHLDELFCVKWNIYTGRSTLKLTFVLSLFPRLETGPLSVLYSRIHFITAPVYFLCLLPTCPPVFRSELLHFCLPACDWKDSLAESPAAAQRGESCNTHTGTFDSSTEATWTGRNAKKGTLITVLPPLSPLRF